MVERPVAGRVPIPAAAGSSGPQRLEQHLRRWRWQLRRWVDHRRLSTPQFVECLQEIGIRPGVTVMVHSSMDQIARRAPQLDAMQLIRILQQLVTEEGTLLMPTFPFVGRQIHYVDSEDSFDPKRTPSRAGMLTEVFRRLHGVVRSLHPTHSVAGWGRHASELLDAHHLGSAFGSTSPFHRLAEFDGLVAGIGVGLFQGFTILHVAEEKSPHTRDRICDPKPRIMKIVQAGSVIRYTLYPLRADCERDLKKLERILLKDGTLRYEFRGGLLFSVARARRFVERACAQLEHDTYFSPGHGDQR